MLLLWWCNVHLAVYLSSHSYGGGDQGVSRVGFLWVSLACQWLSSPYTFTWPSLPVCLISSHRCIHYIGLGLTQITSFYLNYLFMDCLEIHSHSDVLGVKTLTYKLGGVWNTIQTITEECFQNPIICHHLCSLFFQEKSFRTLKSTSSWRCLSLSNFLD